LKDYKDREICVSGKIQEYRGKREIVLTDPQQIKSDPKQARTAKKSVPAR
jgi:hypothetical protein